MLSRRACSPCVRRMGNRGEQARRLNELLGILLGICILLSGFASALASDLAAPGETLEVSPTSMKLQTSRDAQAFVARLLGADGVSIDVTPDVKILLPTVVRNVGNVLLPAADGSGKVVVSYGGHSATIDVTVSKAAADRAISFKLDVMPIFMRAGCNSGGCHGSARGKDGFHLSLFGFDPDGDYQRITREMGTRRVNLAIPEQSLILLKPTAQVPHTGGERFKINSPMYATLLRWLDAGAPQDPPTVAHADSLEILPSQLVLDEGTSQRLTVRAHYSDGTERDVTQLAVFSTTNDACATVTDAGVVSATHRGEAFVLARFATFT
ncbi:MAG TPA: Ig-like domain-containing protein, partial [Tepidisphaeraceae bacterium]|nr:Ig-like domain-containing protein [Tepidisphaeraceae bacterium]